MCGSGSVSTPPILPLTGTRDAGVEVEVASAGDVGVFPPTGGGDVTVGH